MSSPTDACEREAVEVARAVGAGMPTGLRVETGGPAHVRRDIDRQKLEANQVATKLRTVIAGATWKEIRKRVYPKESAAGVARAQERHKGTRADPTGVGRLAAPSSFVSRIRAIQKLWPSIKPDRRKQESRAVGRGGAGPPGATRRGPESGSRHQACLPARPSRHAG